MKAFLILSCFLTNLFPVMVRGAEPSPVPAEESGVMTHGTIATVSNRHIAILTPASLEPVRYCHGEGTVYVDESDKPVTLELMKSGIAVTVFYSEGEGQRMANRVIVVALKRTRSS